MTEQELETIKFKYIKDIWLEAHIEEYKEDILKLISEVEKLRTQLSESHLKLKTDENSKKRLRNNAT